MPQLSQAKTLGGVGSILMLLAPLPAVGWVLCIAGAIVVLVAIKYISEVVQDKSIFSNMLIAILLGVVGLVVGVVVILRAVLATFGLGSLGAGFPSHSAPYFNSAAVPTSGWLGLIAGALTGLAVLWVLLLVSAIFVRRSYSSIGRKIGVGMFGTTGLIYLTGAALTIVLVGFVLLFVALILNAVAFFSIADQPAPQYMAQPASPAAGK
jgi:uncharacterized membrane protein